MIGLLKVTDVIQSKDKMIDKLMIDACKAKLDFNQSFFAGKYDELISKLKILFECPLSLDQIK